MQDTGYTFRKDPENPLVYEIFDEHGNRVEGLDAEAEIDRFFQSQAQEKSDTPGIAAQPVRILAEGDSWINWSVLRPVRPDTFVEVLERQYSVLNLGFPGHKFEEIMQEKQYLTALKAGTIDFFIFSGGGNDLLGGGALENSLKDRATLGANPSAADCLDDTEVNQLLDRLQSGYMTLARETAAAAPTVPLFVHGYDHARPVQDEPWLGVPFENKNYDPQSDLARAVIAELVDRFYGRLSTVAQQNANVTVVNVRRSIGADWFDELHPNDRGAAIVADKFQALLPAPMIV